MDGNDFEDKTNSFLAWLSNAGIALNPKVAVADLRAKSRGRGIVALQNLEEDEVVFSIPRSAIINTFTASNASNTVGSSSLEKMPQWLSLTCLMLAEIQDPNSNWSPYISILPTSLNSLVFWTEEELSELQASTVTSKIGKEAAESMFLQHIAPLGLGFSLEKCHLLASIIMAYAFDIPKTQEDFEAEDGDDLVSDDESEETTLSLIPLADILNADADKNNARLCCNSDQVLEMRTIRVISPSEEILNDYGSLPQSDLLRRYGYVSDHYAKYNLVEITTASTILSTFREELGDEELQNRIEVAEREDIYDDSYDISHTGGEGSGIPSNLISLVYLLLLSNDHFKDIQTSRDDLPSRSKLLTEKVASRLSDIFKLREQEYATTLSEDEDLLRTKNLPTRSVLAIKVRLGEKRVLAEAIKEVEMYKRHKKRIRSGDVSPMKKSRMR